MGAMTDEQFSYLGPRGRWTTLKYGPSFAWPSAPGMPPATGSPGKEEVVALLKEVIPDWEYEFTDLIDFQFVPVVKGKIHLLVSEPNPKAEDGELYAVAKLSLRITGSWC
jgi:hypothetical protein